MNIPAFVPDFQETGCRLCLERMLPGPRFEDWLLVLGSKGLQIGNPNLLKEAHDAEFQTKGRQL
jgi:hypothetical protein